jgi:hypothetical protein
MKLLITAVAATVLMCGGAYAQNTRVPARRALGNRRPGRRKPPIRARPPDKPPLRFPGPAHPTERGAAQPVRRTRTGFRQVLREDRRSRPETDDVPRSQSARTGASSGGQEAAVKTEDFAGHHSNQGSISG